MASSSDEWEEEEQFVLVELQGLLEMDHLRECTTENSFIWGADTENPVLKINRYMFSGEYDETIGTAVFFEETVLSILVEVNGKMQLKYRCHTTRKMDAVRACLQPKGDQGEKESVSEESAIAAKEFTSSKETAP